MNENVLEVLMFLFDNYLTMDGSCTQDEDMLAIELEEAGFESIEINKAFDWLCSLAELQKVDYQSQSVPFNAHRVFSPEEIQKLDVQARGCLLELYHNGVLDFKTRELILDRAMAFEIDEISLEQIRIIIGLVMLNKPNEEEAYPEWVEAVLYDQSLEHLH